MTVTGFEIRSRRAGVPMCVWGDCAPGVPRLRKDSTRSSGFADVTILDRESFPVCRRHRREIEEILCSLLPNTEPVEPEAVA